MNQIGQLILAHPALTHIAVAAGLFAIGRWAFPYIEEKEEAILAKAFALQRAKLKVLGASSEQIKAFDEHEALILQRAADAAKADANQP